MLSRCPIVWYFFRRCISDQFFSILPPFFPPPPPGLEFSLPSWRWKTWRRSWMTGTRTATVVSRKQTLSRKSRKWNLNMCGPSCRTWSRWIRIDHEEFGLIKMNQDWSWRIRIDQDESGLNKLLLYNHISESSEKLNNIREENFLYSYILTNSIYPSYSSDTPCCLHSSSLYFNQIKYKS